MSAVVFCPARQFSAAADASRGVTHRPAQLRYAPVWGWTTAHPTPTAASGQPTTDDAAGWAPPPPPHRAYARQHHAADRRPAGGRRSSPASPFPDRHGPPPAGPAVPPRRESSSLPAPPCAFPPPPRPAFLAFWALSAPPALLTPLAAPQHRRLGAAGLPGPIPSIHWPTT